MIHMCKDCQAFSAAWHERICAGPRVSMALCKSHDSPMRGQWMRPYQGCSSWRPVQEPVLSLPSATGETTGYAGGAAP